MLLSNTTLFHPVHATGTYGYITLVILSKKNTCMLKKRMWKIYLGEKYVQARAFWPNGIYVPEMLWICHHLIVISFVMQASTKQITWCLGKVHHLLGSTLLSALLCCIECLDNLDKYLLGSAMQKMINLHIKSAGLSCPNHHTRVPHFSGNLRSLYLDYWQLTLFYREILASRVLFIHLSVLRVHINLSFHCYDWLVIITLFVLHINDCLQTTKTTVFDLLINSPAYTCG